MQLCAEVLDVVPEAPLRPKAGAESPSASAVGRVPSPFCLPLSTPPCVVGKLPILPNYDGNSAPEGRGQEHGDEYSEMMVVLSFQRSVPSVADVASCHEPVYDPGEELGVGRAFRPGVKEPRGARAQWARESYASC